MITVATNGCFDILHAGHVQYLQEAKKLGDKLIVGLNSDESVKKLKGSNRPYNTERNRAFVLQALECVDEVVIFDSITCSIFLKDIKPDIYVKGGDYTIDTLPECEKKTISRYCKEVKILKKYDSPSTTDFLRKMELE
jgi:rfaE bifunctional protein nucleotidyltransferase chain/domain